MAREAKAPEGGNDEDEKARRADAFSRLSRKLYFLNPKRFAAPCAQFSAGSCTPVALGAYLHMCVVSEMHMLYAACIYNYS